jgi:hypothetical protein
MWATGLPRALLQWPAAMSSLTVARQRGIYTRFPTSVRSDEMREPNLKERKKRVREI